MAKRKNPGFEFAVKEAKRLKKKFPGRYKKYSDYLKEAWAIYFSKHRKKVGATKFIERGETARTKPRRVYQQKRSPAGRFKGVRKIAGRKTRGPSQDMKKLRELEAKYAHACMMSMKADTVKDVNRWDNVAQKLKKECWKLGEKILFVNHF